MVTLTRRMFQAKTFIETYHAENGIPPSHQEIADGLGLKSKSNAARYVEALVERGYLSRLPGKRKARNLTLAVRP